MKQVRGLWFGLLLAGLGACTPEQVQLADGSSTGWNHWDDRWLAINYWAEWCTPCREEIPELNELHHDRTATGIVVLGVNYDGLANPELAETMQRMDIQFPVLLDDPLDRFGYRRPDRLPITVMINPAGEVAEILEGAQTRKHLELIVSVGAAD